MYFKNQLTLGSLPVGKKGKVISIRNNHLKRRFLDLGIIPGTIITNERHGPFGNPIAFNIRGSIIAIRRDDAKNILINMV